VCLRNKDQQDALFFLNSFSIIYPLLYVLHTSDLRTSRETILGTFADDSAIFSTHEDPTVASLNLQKHLHIIEKWPKKWKIKVNESKSSHITFTLWKGHCPAVNINQTIIPQTEAVKYLGLHFNCRLNWKEHIVRKRKQIDLKTKEINWLLGKKFPSIYRKQITHLQSSNQTYMELWNRTVGLHQQVQHSHQRSQSKILSAIANAPWYVINHTLHTDFNIPYVMSSMKESINITSNWKPIPIHYWSHDYNL